MKLGFIDAKMKNDLTLIRVNIISHKVGKIIKVVIYFYPKLNF